MPNPWELQLDALGEYIRAQRRHANLSLRQLRERVPMRHRQPRRMANDPWQRAGAHVEVRRAQGADRGVGDVARADVGDAVHHLRGDEGVEASHIDAAADAGALCRLEEAGQRDDIGFLEEIGLHTTIEV